MICKRPSGRFFLPTRAAGCLCFGRGVALAIIAQRIQKPDVRADRQRKRPPPYLEAAVVLCSSSQAKPFASLASLQRRFQYPLDFGTQPKFHICVMNAAVVGGRGRLRADHVHDVHHAPELRSVIHHHSAAVLGVVGRKTFVAIKAAFIGGSDLSHSNRHLRIVCTGTFHRRMQVEFQTVIWKISGTDQLCAGAAVGHLLCDHIGAVCDVFHSGVLLQLRQVAGSRCAFMSASIRK